MKGRLKDEQVIALSGCKGSGKDYCADLLREEGYVILSFSDHLKVIAASLFPACRIDVAPEDKEDVVYKSSYGGVLKSWSHRDIWCALNVLVEINPTILTEPVYEQAVHVIGAGRKVCVKDLRPHNHHEYETVRKLAGHIVYVENMQDPISSRGRHETEDADGYERIKANAHYVFENYKNGPQGFNEFMEKYNACK